MPLDLPKYLPSHKEPVKKTAPTYVRSIMMPFCRLTVNRNNIEYRDFGENIVEYRNNVISVIAQAYYILLHTYIVYSIHMYT